MNRDKQIEEMAKICRGYFNGKCYAKGEAQECNLICSRGDIMRDLYTAGYRKASDVAREIIAYLVKFADDKEMNEHINKIFTEIGEMLERSENGK